MIKTTRLDNGIRVVSHQVPHMHTAALGIWVANGTRQEPAGLNGIAHFVEHLLFKGTERRSARDISREMDSLGGILNAFTGHEYVCYYGKVLSKFLPQAVDILSDIFLNSIFPEEEIEKERNVVLQEIKMREDSPEESIHDKFHQNFWNGHPLGMPILGTSSSVQAITRDSILDYRAANYRSSEIVIAAAGNVAHDELCRLVSPFFAPLAAGAIAAAAKPVRGQSSKSVNVSVRTQEQSLLCFGTPALHYSHEGKYVQMVLNTLLGGGMSSRLFQEVREKRGLAYSIYSYVISHADSGALVVYSGTEKKHCSELLDIVQEELARLKAEFVPADELNSTREQLKGKLLMSLESSDSLMMRIARGLVYQDRYQPIEEILEGLDRVTPEDVMGLAGTLFDGSAAHLELMGDVDGLDISKESLFC